MKVPSTPVPRLVEQFKRGKIVVLLDSEDRENEGDFVQAAERVTPESINFMLQHGRGLVCLALSQEICRKLDLPPMVDPRLNNSRFGTAFTVAIDAARGIGSGESAHDRARTIRAAVAEDARPEDLVRPGHVFPIQAQNGGVLVRAGHTEAGVDLARLAGIRPAAVICPIMGPDGEMASREEILRLARRHGLAVGTIASLIEYRRRRERLVEKIIAVRLPTSLGEFRLHLYRSLVDDYHHLALCQGWVGETEQKGRPAPLVRVHSECLTGDIFHSRRCDCGDQLERSLRMISRSEAGCLLYIRQEGRGIGLVNKLRSYALQDQGLDTVEANQKLGFPADLRNYGVGAQILFDLGIRSLRLLTNNPKKIHGIEGFGLRVVEQIPIETVPNETNVRYLRTKKMKLGHLLRNV